MVKESNISWTCFTWNIATGCDKVSEGCKFCYMMRDMDRYGRSTEVVRTKGAFYKPDKIKEPSLVFACSWTDFFHPGCDGFREEAWDVIRRNPHHTFQILTKRPERILGNLPKDWDEGYKNVWLGISVEDQNNYLSRMHYFKRIPAFIKFLSVEPLLGPVKLDEYLFLTARTKEYPFPKLAERYRTKLIDFIDWVIVGGESGNETGKWGYRECKLEWIEGVIEACKRSETPVFIKQLGTFLSKGMGLKDRHGQDMSEFSEHMQLRQFPNSYKL